MRGRIVIGALLVLGVIVAAQRPAEASTRARLEGLTSREARLQMAVDAGEIHTCAVGNLGR